MRIHQLEVFCHVYEQRSVSGAGQVLRLSQPAVSMQVRQLEQELGIQLFERLGRQLVPTQAAHALYGYAAVIRGAFSEAQRMMAEFRDGQRGTIHLGASTTGVIYYLPALLRDFRRRYPDTVVTVEADLTERVRDGVVQYLFGDVGEGGRGGRRDGTTAQGDAPLAVHARRGFPAQQFREAGAGVPARQGGARARPVRDRCNYSVRRVRLPPE